jgi:hypothetical protein
MFASDGVAASLDSVAHVIQVALTPVFLLSGISALLNVFSTRLGRVSDKVDQLAQQLVTADAEARERISAQLAFQRLRSWVLDAAVVLGALAGVATCGATLTLFVGALRDRAGASILFLLFGGAVLCTLGALAAFMAEMLIAGHGLREAAAPDRAKTSPAE